MLIRVDAATFDPTLDHTGEPVPILGGVPGSDWVPAGRWVSPWNGAYAIAELDPGHPWARIGPGNAPFPVPVPTG